MPVPEQTPVATFTGNGVTTVFPLAWGAGHASHVVVEVDGVKLTEGVDYTASVNGTSGTVTFGAAPTTGAAIVITRDTPLERVAFDYQEAGPFLAETIDADNDSPWRAMQDLRYRYTLAPTLPRGHPLAGVVSLPPPGAGKYLRWNAPGTNLEAVDAVYALGSFVASGAGAVERSAQSKMGDTVSIADYGAKPLVDCSNAIIKAAAATSGVVLVPAGEFVAQLSASQSAAVLAVLNRIRCDGTLALTLASGEHAMPAQVVINSPDAQRISIVGADLITTTALAQVSASGSAKAYSVTIEVASSAGAEVGDYALIGRDVTGTGDYYCHAGIWKVTAVDAGGPNRLTLLNTHHGAAWPTNTLTGGTVKVLKTRLRFAGCDGIRFEGGQSLGLLDRVAIVGDYDVSAATGTTGAHGIVTSTPVLVGGSDSNAPFNPGGFVTLGASVGVSGFGEQGIVVSGRGMMVANYVASCSNRKRGIYAEGGHIRAKFSVCSGNGEDGFISDATGFVQANLGMACGNGLNGYWSTNHSLIIANQTRASGNLRYGYEARGLTRLAADDAIALNNALSGFSASDGGMIDADRSTAQGSGSDGFGASFGAMIDCNDSISQSNGGYGYHGSYGSSMQATGSAASGNTSGDYYSRNGSVVTDTSGAPVAEDIPNYSVGWRVYNPAKTSYAGFNVSSIGDLTIAFGATNRIVLKTTGTIHPSGNGTQDLGRTTEVWKQAFIGRVSLGSSAAVFDTSGTGSPEGSISASVGSTYRQLDGGAGSTFWVKESGTGNTGWVAK